MQENCTRSSCINICSHVLPEAFPSVTSCHGGRSVLSWTTGSMTMATSSARSCKHGFSFLSSLCVAAVSTWTWSVTSRSEEIWRRKAQAAGYTVLALSPGDSWRTTRRGNLLGRNQEMTSGSSSDVTDSAFIHSRAAREGRAQYL